jgi:hypothetical protein
MGETHADTKLIVFSQPVKVEDTIVENGKCSVDFIHRFFMHVHPIIL